MWEDTVNQLLGAWGNAAINEAYVQPYALKQQALQTLGADGLMYVDGKRGAVPTFGAGMGGGLGVLLIIGVVALVVLKD